MARITKIIETPRLNDLVTNQGTTKGLLTLINEYLAPLLDIFVITWRLDVRFLNKRMDPQWMFEITYDTGAPAIATPFTVKVAQATSIADLDTAIAAINALAAAEFVVGPQMIKLDSDEQGFSKQYVAGFLCNFTGGLVPSNYIALVA